MLARRVRLVRPATSLSAAEQRYVDSLSVALGSEQAPASVSSARRVNQLYRRSDLQPMGGTVTSQPRSSSEERLRRRGVVAEVGGLTTDPARAKALADYAWEFRQASRKLDRSRGGSGPGAEREGAGSRLKRGVTARID
ncbi:MAG: hypothetical protein JKY65_17200 [Planctomycetes bacterium]|nr:hypothetical protein [Planctomycetota bacterium]